eukprot:CAMPEP_0174717036 /NCGR_PEP_ID=MMETSP1094-20130205/25692_1 /TAXON_ID=156173 /ORGANISM="Chrysochromulina brevifilum, Strain UTEX LB 985" /LENGTH=116 /DNA_ID=CAMNT_0015916919 /DNA_START=145 /DNA_END=495 /DNA_ORIENTATION=+
MDEARLKPQAMLLLMKGGAPNAEVLLAKNLDDMLAIGARHGIKIDLPTGAGEPTDDSTDHISDATESVSSSYDIRRFTAPPSAYEPSGVAASEALTRARLRRVQHSFDSHGVDAEA